MTLEAEILANFQRFEADWKAHVRARLEEAASSDERFSSGYRSLVTMQAWRSSLVSSTMSDGALRFFLEAQNDGVISQIQASMGSWRVAMKSLRSLIENVFVSLYFSDHEVELRRWEKGRFRISFSDLLEYFKNHPEFLDVPDAVSGLSLVKQEYDKLSKAVHASSEEFRMTEDGLAIQLWHTDDAHIGKWKTRQSKVLQAVNQVLLVFYRHSLQGAAHAGMRETVAFAIPAEKDEPIRTNLGIRLIR